MNKERRAKLEVIAHELENLKEDLDEVASEEREYYDNMPENMQSGDKGTAADSAATALEAAAENVQSALDELGSVE